MQAAGLQTQELRLHCMPHGHRPCPRVVEAHTTSMRLQIYFCHIESKENQLIIKLVAMFYADECAVDNDACSKIALPLQSVFGKQSMQSEGGIKELRAACL